jgi:bisphosphoglycerate-independent phosphoglycerate mutase (AlkP superfamily)
MLNKQMENNDVQLPLTQLADVAPFILKNMSLPVPHEMMK